MSQKRASIVEVAQVAGVSRQTVSRVINNSPHVLESTRQTVLEAIDQLNYRPSNSARALATQHTRTIGIIAGGVSYYGPLSTISSLEKIAREHSWYISIAIVDENNLTREAFNDVINGFMGQGVEACIIVAPTDSMLEAALSSRVRVPRVIVTAAQGHRDISRLLSRQVNEQQSDVSFVMIDQESAEEYIAHQLIREENLANTLFIAGPQEWRDGYTRRLAWKNICESYGIMPWIRDASAWSAQLGYSIMNDMLADIASSAGIVGTVDTVDTVDTADAIDRRHNKKLPTHIVASNDLLALGVLRSLHEHGLHIPDDISVIGYDDMPGADNAYPPLTTVRPDFRALGAAAIYSAFDAIGYDYEYNDDDTQMIQKLIPTQLIIRNSVKPTKNSR